MPDTQLSRFDRLRLQNVRCFRDTEIPLDPRVTVIIGANGSGKTTLVEALASLTYGRDEGLPTFPFRRDTRTGEVALYGPERERPVAKWTARAKRSTKQTLPEDQYLFAYGRYRRVFSPEGEAAEPRRAPSPAELLDELAHHAGERRTVTLNRPDNNLLRDLSRYLVALDFGRASDPRLESIWRKLNASLPKLEASLTEIRMESRKFGKVPMVVRNGVALELSELSDGYQALLVVIFDLMLRYAYLFQIKNPLEGQALVGIDEVDLHLHPRWQRKVAAQLTELFPNTQFVLTTHSPIVVQGAIDRGSTVVTLREENGAVVASRLSPRLRKRLHGAEVGSLLLEHHLFGVESRYSTEYSEIEKRVDQLQRRISRGTATDTDHRELSQQLSKLEELVVREDKRRADSSTVAQMARLQAAFVKDLLSALKKARS
jgi:hypothetical protein